MTLATARSCWKPATTTPRRRRRRWPSRAKLRRILRKNERDWYSFSAQKGQVLTIDAFGDRIGSPVDLYYTLFRENGTVVTNQDENPEITAISSTPARTIRLPIGSPSPRTASTG